MDNWTRLGISAVFALMGGMVLVHQLQSVGQAEEHHPAAVTESVISPSPELSPQPSAVAGTEAEAQASSQASPEPSVSPSEAPSGSPQVSPSPTEPPLSAAEAKVLLSEFSKALSTQLEALRHRQVLERQELREEQKARQSKWDQDERDARHKFFATHPKGPDRRTYIGNYLARRKIFQQILSDEKAQHQREQQAAFNAMVQDQGLRLKEFKADLARQQRPPASLWPSGE